MGLDAVVRCRCWEDGKVSAPPPFAEHVRMDQEGWLELDLPWEENQERHATFDEWLRTCCAHEDMEQAGERISNWSGYRLFQQQMQDFGLDQFPTLTEVLPAGNGGRVPAERAAAALQELDDFCARSFGDSVDLVAVDTEQRIHSYIRSYGGVFFLSPAGRAGVDPHGFFVRHKEGEKEEVEVFRSTRFLQECLGPVELTPPYSVPPGSTGPGQTGRKEFRLTDVATGRSVLTQLGIAVYGEEASPDGKHQATYPTELEVRRRQMDYTDFLYIVEPLRKVFKASLETGNPVCWR